MTQPHPPAFLQQVELPIDPQLPDWLDTPEPPTRKPSPSQVELSLTQYEQMFEWVIPEIESGRSLADVLRNDHRQPKYNTFRSWIHKDPERQRRYYKAKEIGTDALQDKALQVVFDEDSLVDINRVKLQIDTIKWSVGVDNRKRYGETKTIEFGGSISITEAMQQAKTRVIEGTIIEEIEDATITNQIGYDDEQT